MRVIRRMRALVVLGQDIHVLVVDFALSVLENVAKTEKNKLGTGFGLMRGKESLNYGENVAIENYDL
jgi:hypothetical protein